MLSLVTNLLCLKINNSKTQPKKPSHTEITEFKTEKKVWDLLGFFAINFTEERISHTVFKQFSPSCLKSEIT